MKSQVASYSSISPKISTKPIEIICNPLVAKLDLVPKKTPKYKKVSKSKR